MVLRLSNIILWKSKEAFGISQSRVELIRVKFYKQVQILFYKWGKQTIFVA